MQAGDKGRGGKLEKLVEETGKLGKLVEKRWK